MAEKNYYDKPQLLVENLVYSLEEIGLENYYVNLLKKKKQVVDR